VEQISARSRDGGIPSCGSYVHEEAHDRAQPPHSTSPQGKSRAAMLWGVGSTILSVLGFLAWGLFEQYNSSLAELRADLKHFNEASSTFVKKDTLSRFREQYKAQFTDMQSMSASNRQLDAELKASERAREEMSRELIRIRERLAFVEGRQSVSPSVPEKTPVKQGEKPDDHPPLVPHRMSSAE
jgi:hypothetical protein